MLLLIAFLWLMKVLLNRHRYRARTEVIRGTSREEYEKHSHKANTAGKPPAKARMTWPQVV